MSNKRRESFDSQLKENFEKVKKDAGHGIFKRISKEGIVKFGHKYNFLLDLAWIHFDSSLSSDNTRISYYETYPFGDFNVQIMTG